MTFFHHTDVTISTNGQLAAFSDKLPGRAKRCIGLSVSADTHHATKALGDVSISLNGERGQTVSMALRVLDAYLQRRSDFLRFIQDVQPNSHITGYVEDFSNAPSVPYTVRIYFMLTD